MTTLLFIDFDHENERHAEIILMPGSKISIERRVETNEDYLDTDPPDDWYDLQELQFASSDALNAFITALTDKLLDACFDFFDDMEQVDDSDVARERIAALLTSYDEEPIPDGLSKEEALAQVDAFTTFPR